MADEGPPETAPTPNSRGRRWIVIPIVMMIAAAIIVYVMLTSGWVATDDAQVEGNLVPISPRVSGYVDRIYVNDNERVAAGQMLVQLDPRDLREKLRSMEATLALQQASARAATSQVAVTQRAAPAGEQQAGAAVNEAAAGVTSSESQIAAAEAQAAAAAALASAAGEAITSARSLLRTAEAQIQSSQAALEATQAEVTAAESQATKAAKDDARYQQLVKNNVVSKDQAEAVHTANVSAQAGLTAARRRVDSAAAALAQANASKAAAEADLKQAVMRAASGEATAKQARASARTARTALSQSRARLAQAKAAESGARTATQQISISAAQGKAAAARARQAEADVRNARLQLSYTRLTAPVQGLVSQKSVEPGQYVQPGQMLMALVPLTKVWVVANFKETDLAQMRAGQRAVVEVDAYPGKHLKAKVDSIGAATGAKFTLLPPENATGNFVKVVQRLPVKIAFTEPLPEGVVLRPGMNVVARVQTGGGS